jgi:hypothetical protein
MDPNPYAAPQTAVVDTPARLRLLPVAMASWALPLGAFAFSFVFDALLPNHTTYYGFALAAAAFIGFACAVRAMLGAWRDRRVRVHASVGLFVAILFASYALQWHHTNSRIDAAIQRNRGAKP